VLIFIRDSSGSESEEGTGSGEVSSGGEGSHDGTPVPCQSTSGQTPADSLQSQPMDVEGEETTGDTTSESFIVGAKSEQGEGEQSVEEKRADLYHQSSDVKTPIVECSNSSSSESVSKPAEEKTLDASSSDIGNQTTLAEQGDSSRKCSDNSGSNQTAKQPPNAQSPSGKDNNNVHNNTSKNVESFNSFQFWRAPLPEVDIVSDLIINEESKDCIQKVEETEAPSQSDSSNTDTDQVVPEVAAIAERLDDITSCIEVLNRSTGLESEANNKEDPGVMMFTANVNMVNEESETVANIGSTHVLGEHLNEGAMHVVNGVAIRGEGMPVHVYLVLFFFL
jgi:hypothetical protein